MGVTNGNINAKTGNLETTGNGPDLEQPDENEALGTSLFSALNFLISWNDSGILQSKTSTEDVMMIL